MLTREVVRVFTRHARNVVEVNGLPLSQQRDEIRRKRRHGMGFLGLLDHHLARMNTARLSRLQFTEDVAREMALPAGKRALELAPRRVPPNHERGIHGRREMLRRRPENGADGWKPGARIRALLHARYSATCSGLGACAATGRAARADRSALHGTIARSLYRHDLAVAGQQCQQWHEPSFAHTISVT